MANNINNFVPEIYSQKLALQDKKFTNLINNHCNREWEGEIKSFGDTVRITLPNPDAIVIGEGIVAETSSIAPTQTTLTIDKSKNFAFKITDIETAQSQFNIISGQSATALQKMQDTICVEIMEEVLSDSAIANMGTSYSAPKEVVPDDVYDFLVDVKMQLTSTGHLNAEGFYQYSGNSEEAKELNPVITVSPKFYGSILKSRLLTHPTVAGDDILHSAKKPQVVGFEIFVDTYLTSVTNATTDVQPFIAGTKMGITFANQFNTVESLRDPLSFATIVRGIELYGYKILHPKAIVAGWVKPLAQHTTAYVA